MIVVTGATGNIGRPLVTALAAAGEQVTAVSRGLPTAPAPDGVHHRQADLARPESLKPVFDGAEALFLLIAGGGEGIDPAAVLGAALAGGIRRVVLLSSQAAGTRPRSLSHEHLRAMETAVRDQAPEWTVLRPSGFHSNALLWAEPVRAQRTVAAPFGEVGLPAIDPADIAEVAARVLRDPGHTGRVLELTGPAPVSPREQAEAIGQAVGEPVRFVEQSRAEARERLLRFMPEPVVEGTLAILGEPTDAEQRVSPEVERILGRPARPFTDWAVRHRDMFL
ncbi:NAD(P)H-binding protein [Streptomyces palmae]|uniref:NAD-dependent epimerase/dehydratase family protein n=1 Tax=Streptomyces palmae TaxID=1701085 RepID=A0A4Z0H5A4_9ACTN|nr:NAD(P)H-binding protein [Streptomyces palmae]TGB05892.1 NAD-dependent epimerase/dehydratase family protein [Streptomyces palmae]